MAQAVQVEYLISGIMHGGEPLASGQVYFYETDGTTSKTIWNDANKISAASNPVTLDSNGKAEIFADGTYTVLIKTSGGSTIQTLENQYFFPNSGTVSTSEIDASSFGAATNATISTAVSSASGADRTVYLNPGNWAISDNLTIPSNINLKFLMGAYVTVENTKNLTIQGTVEGPNYNIFRGDGTVTYDARTNIIPSIWAIGGSHDNLTLDGTVTIKDNLIVNGTTTTINSTVVTIDDPIFTLGGDTAPASDDNKDRGIEFRWHNGSTAKLGFFGFDDSAGKFVFLPDATNSSEVFSGTAGTIVANLEGDITGGVGTLTSLSVSGDATFDTSTLKVDSTNNRVGVGLSSPSHRLDVDNSTLNSGNVGTAARIKASGTSSTAVTVLNVQDSFYVDGAGNVGIGTDSPSAKLDVFGGDIRLNSASSAASGTRNLQFWRDGLERGRVQFDYSNSRLTLQADGDMSFLTGGENQRMILTSSGSLLLNYTSEPSLLSTGQGFSVNPSTQLTIASSDKPVAYFNRTDSSSSGGTLLSFRLNGTQEGSISITSTATSYNTTSDYRLKENVTPIIDGIQRLMQLKPSRFNFIKNKNQTVDGFLAHEVQEIIPEAITGEKDAVNEKGEPEFQSIDHSKIVPLLVASLQQLKQELDLIKNG